MTFIEYFFIAIAVHWISIFIYNVIIEYRKLGKDNSAEDDEEENWVFPIHIEYTPNKTHYYAWDVEDVFIGQSNNYETLLTNIRERWNIPSDRLIIKTEKALYETASETK